MSSSFQKCPNGHYYDSSLSKCPYCPSSAAPVPHVGGAQRTEHYPGEFADDGKTKPYFEGAEGSTVVSPDGMQKTLIEGMPQPPQPQTATRPSSLMRTLKARRRQRDHTGNSSAGWFHIQLMLAVLTSSSIREEISSVVTAIVRSSFRTEQLPENTP